jgi:hypothetical protein
MYDYEIWNQQLSVWTKEHQKIFYERQMDSYKTCKFLRASEIYS